MGREREYNLDLLRILASFMVVFLHVAAQNWDTIPPASAPWQIFNIYDILVRSAVPIFFMLSGKLFLSRNDVSLKKLFSKNILRFVFIYFLWSFLYSIDQIGIKTLLSSPDLNLLFTTFVSSKYHLWYLPALVSIYFIIPVFIAMKSYKNGKILDYTAILFIAFAIIKYSITLIPMNQSFLELIRKFNFELDGFCGYFILGYVLDKHKEKLKKIPTFDLIIFFLVTAALTAWGSSVLSVKSGIATAMLYDYFFIATFIEAVIIFALFLRMSQFNFNKTAETIIRKLSSYTLFVYLFHPFVLQHLSIWFGLNSLSFNAVLSVPFLAVLIFILCIAVAIILDKIPFIRKIFL